VSATVVIILGVSLAFGLMLQLALSSHSSLRYGDTESENGALRVLFLHRDLPFHGGVPRCFYNLATACDRRRIAFHIASFREASDWMKGAFGALGITPFCLSDHGYFRPARTLRRIVADNRIDVIAATTFKAYLCAKYAARGRDVRVVFWIHGVKGIIERVFRRTINAVLSRRDPMLFVSRAARDALVPKLHRGRVEVVYNGVGDITSDPAYAPYGPEMRTELGLPADALVLVYTAEFVASKDHPCAIAAMHELVSHGTNVHLLLVGTGNDIDRFRHMALAGPAAHHIHFLGARTDARRLLGVADVYIHPGRHEGFGLAAVEAMLAGVPVVAARDGAFVEYISTGENGILFHPGDARDLADGVLIMARNRSYARIMGLAGRLSCLKKFNIQQFADAVCRFIEEAHPAAVRRRPGVGNVVQPPLESVEAQAVGANL
jgi:glycosyltransferase involved in cell wall biosynthesis